MPLFFSTTDGCIVLFTMLRNMLHNSHMSTVVDETKLLIQNRKLTVSKIAKLTGVSSRWIFYFMKDEIKNPSIHKVQRIYGALKTDMPSTNTKSIKNPDG